MSSALFRLAITSLLFLPHYTHLLAFSPLTTPHTSPENQRTLAQLSMTTTTDVDDEIKSTMMNPKYAKGVIFDIDGTLADSWKLGFDATQVVLKNNDIELITEELYHECTKYCTPDRLARHAGFVPENGEEFEKVGEKLAQEFDELYVGLVSLETAGFYDGIQDLILSLPKNRDNVKDSVKVAALTNACVAYAHAVLKTNCPVLSSDDENDNGEKVGIYDLFLSIHGADTVPKPKPDPSGLFQCCNEIELDPKECVYIGDSPSDAIAAKSAGMVAIGVLWGSHPEESLKNAPFDYLCKTVGELRSLLLIE